MRITLTLDPDVAATLQARVRELGLPFRQVVNDALRRGLSSASGGKPYRMPTHALGALPGVDVDRALALADRQEAAAVADELHRLD